MPSESPESDDPFADIDDALDDIFGETAQDQQFKEMTQQFLRGSGDMTCFDKANATAHAAADDDSKSQQIVDDEWDDFADDFFGDRDNSTDTATNATTTDPRSMAAASKTIRFEFGSETTASAPVIPQRDAAISAALNAISPPEAALSHSSPSTASNEKYNLFLRKMLKANDRKAAVKIIIDLINMDEADAEKLCKKPIIKVLIEERQEIVENAHALFTAAGLISTIKQCN